MEKSFVDDVSAKAIGVLRAMDVSLTGFWGELQFMTCQDKQLDYISEKRVPSGKIVVIIGSSSLSKEVMH